MLRKEADNPERLKAIIDVGSNSVRLVVFADGERVPAAAFNEKVLCGLGQGLSETGQLNAKAMDLAVRTIRRYVTLSRAMKVSEIDVVGTAAARDASNGAQFAKLVKSEAGVPMRIISGEEEARVSALGVLAGIPDAEGFVGDLGGGSLELVDLAEGTIHNKVTLPVGPLRLADLWAEKRKQAIDQIDRALSGVNWLGELRGRNFYAVGGAWRTLARVHMAQANYPLHILQHYEMRREDVRELGQVIARLGKESLRRIPGVSPKRLNHMPLAAAILDRVLVLGQPEKVIISALGLREGLLYDSLPAEQKQLDPLLESCRVTAAQYGRFEEHGDLIMSWVAPLFANETAAQKRLRQAACMLSDIAWRGHPDYRAEMVMDAVLYSQMIGIDHPGRVWLAFAMFACYGGDLERLRSSPLAALLSDEQFSHAGEVGLAIRLAQRISGGTAQVFDQCSLSATAYLVQLTVPAASSYLVNDVVARRLNALAEHCGKLARVEAA